MMPHVAKTVVRVRRLLHRTPELAHHEWRTAELIESELRTLGLDPMRPGPTSVAVLIGPAGRPPDIGFRADLDALPIQEESDAPYASTIDGAMHACGHDGHAAALVGLATALCSEPLDRSALLVFQQAEESYPSGAPIVLDGLSCFPLPSEFYAFHVWPQLDAGSIGVREGTVLGSVTAVTFRIVGAPGRRHGTSVGNGGVDALAAGVDLYRELRRVFGAGRLLGAARPSSLTFGTLRAGSVPSAAPLDCTIEATLRSVSWSAQGAALNQLTSVVDEVTERTAAAIDIEVLSGIRPPVVNDPACVERVREVCRRRAIDCVDYPAEPAAVSDDFGWFIDGSPGAFIFVGCGSASHQADLHTPTFDFDEAVLGNVVDIAIELTRSA